MMLELKIDLPWSELDAALRIIFSAADAMRPTHVSDEEDSERRAVTSVEKPARLLGVAGGFLWAPECAYDIGISPSKAVTIFALSENAIGLKALLSSLCELEVGFGYACAEYERTHRNRVVRKMAYGTHEAWVGRDYSRYLPGIYWLTIVPVALQQKLGVSVDLLRAAALEMRLIANRNWFVRLYENPGDWERQSPRIDEWCELTPGVFSKKPAIEALASAETFLEASDALAEWR